MKQKLDKPVSRIIALLLFIMMSVCIIYVSYIWVSLLEGTQSCLLFLFTWCSLAGRCSGGALRDKCKQALSLVPVHKLCSNQNVELWWKSTWLWGINAFVSNISMQLVDSSMVSAAGCDTLIGQQKHIILHSFMFYTKLQHDETLYGVKRSALRTYQYLFGWLSACSHPLVV